MNSQRAFQTSAGAGICRKFATAAVLGVWGALLAGFLGRFAWPLDLFSHFLLQYALLFALFAIALLILERHKLAALSLAGALVSAGALIGYAGLPAQPAETRSKSFRLVSFNVWFRSSDDARIAEYLEHSSADAIVLQELTGPRAIALHARLRSYPYLYVGYGDRRNSAVVFSRWPILASESIPLSPQGVHAARVTLQWRDSTVTLLGVHLHWPLGPRNSRLRNQEMAGLATLAKSHDGPLLVAGDFNVTPWSAHFQEMLTGSGTKDCAAGHGMAATWPSHLGPLGIRIDHCLASNDWRSIDVSAGPHLGSDHRPLIAELVLL